MYADFLESTRETLKSLDAMVSRDWQLRHVGGLGLSGAWLDWLAGLGHTEAKHAGMDWVLPLLHVTMVTRSTDTRSPPVACSDGCYGIALLPPITWRLRWRMSCQRLSKSAFSHPKSSFSSASIFYLKLVHDPAHVFLLTGFSALLHIGMNQNTNAFTHTYA